MDFNKAALEMHETHHGKVGIVSKVEVKTRDDLSTAYTPGVAEPCRKIRENPDDVYKYTFKSNMVAVVSNGTAVLGLGDIGPEAGLPVMEGKAVLFKEFGGVDAFPICIDAHDAASVIAACKAIAPTFGGINLEDIKSPECFEIEENLERELDIPVFHDDQHGTAIVVTAALINALRVVGKKMEDVHIVLNGPGAAGTAIIKMLMTAGAKDIIAVDQFGTLYKGCNSAEAHKNWLGEVTNPRQIKGGLKEALEGADVFIGVSKPGILTTELCRTMNKDAIVFVHAPADPVQCIPAGVLAPALGEHPELAVHPLHIGREHHALVAVALCCRRDEVGIFECARVDADLVRTALEHPVKIFQRVDAAAHRERDKNFAGDAGQDIREQRPALEAGGDIVEHKFICTGSVVHAGHFHRVGHVPDAFKVRALDHAAIAHIKAGNNAFGDHVISPPFTPAPAARSAQGPVRRCTGSCLKWQRQCPFFSVPEALLRTRCRRWP